MNVVQQATGHHICIKNDKRGREPIWIDKEKRKYWCFCEITDSHLLNIIHMLQRVYIPFPCFQGDMAQYYAEMDYFSDSKRLDEAIGFFLDEAKERGLKP